MNGASACSGSMQNAPPHWRIVNPDEAARTDPSALPADFSVRSALRGRKSHENA
jgi:hypothetical protein